MGCVGDAEVGVGVRGSGRESWDDGDGGWSSGWRIEWWVEQRRKGWRMERGGGWSGKVRSEEGGEEVVAGGRWRMERGGGWSSEVRSDKGGEECEVSFGMEW